MGNLDDHLSFCSTTSPKADIVSCSEVTEGMAKLLPLALAEDQSREEIEKIKNKVRLLIEEEQNKGRL